MKFKTIFPLMFKQYRGIRFELAYCINRQTELMTVDNYTTMYQATLFLHKVKVMFWSSIILAGISWKDYLSFYSNKKRGEWTEMKLVVTILYRLSVMITHTRMREKKIFFCRLWANYKLVHNQNNTTIDNMFWQAQKKSELVFKI